MHAWILAALLLPAVSVAAPPPRPELPEATTPLQAGGRRALLTEGSGAPAGPGDALEVDLTAWSSEGTLLMSTHATGTRMVVIPGRGTLAPAVEEALTGARRGDVLVVEAALAADAPPARLLLEVHGITAVRIPPEHPPTVPEGGWQVRDSGLGVADLVVGTGDEATRGATVLVEYTGWLEDGRRFDSSLARAAPFGFTIGAHEVIPGWEEGVQGMRIGGTRLLRVPYKLGYGSAGNPPTIPRKATLLFEVRLLEVRAR